MEKDKSDPRKLAENLGDGIRAKLARKRNEKTSSEVIIETEKKAEEFAMETETDGVQKSAENTESFKKRELTDGEKAKIYGLKKDLESIFDRKEFENYKKKNVGRLAEYVKQILKQAKDNIKKGQEYDALDILLDKAEKSKATTMIRILGEIKTNRIEQRKATEKLNKIKKDIAYLKNEIKVAEDSLEKVNGDDRRKKIISERLLLQRESLEKLEFERDMIEGENVGHILLEEGSKGELKKIFKKNGKATPVDVQEKFEGTIYNTKIARGDLIQLAGSLKTSPVLNIKKCSDGSYVVETNTSYYRLIIKEGLINNAEEAVEETEDKEVESEIELTEVEKNEAMDFFDKHILPLHKVAGDGTDVVDFLKEQFIETAKLDSFFLDGDDLKIEKAWEFLANNVRAKVEALEEKERQKDTKEREEIKEDWTLEDINERLKSAGAKDEDIKYFFTLVKKDRLDFLNSNDEDLEFRIGKLKEMREKDEARQENAEKQEGDINEEVPSEKNEGEEKKLENERVLKYLGEEVERCRKEYVQEENEVGVKVSRLKNFFRNLISIDNTYEIEKELEMHKEAYETALKNHLEAVVDILGLSSEEELKNLLNYTKFGEKLNLINAKEDLKFEKNPRLESFKSHFKSWAVDALEGYKNLLAKPREIITQKTGSKIKGFAGGMIAVGGAMAFASNYIPGLRNVTVPLSVAIATLGFQKRAQEKIIVENEKSLEKGLADLQTRLAGMDDNLRNEILKRELGMEIKNIPEKAVQEVEEKYRRYLFSFGKAVAVSTLFYEAGHYIKGHFFNSGTNHTEQILTDDTLSKAGVKLPEVNDETYHINRHPETDATGVTAVRPSGIHGMQNAKIMDEPKIEGITSVKEKNIQEIFEKLGIKNLDSNNGKFSVNNEYDEVIPSSETPHENQFEGVPVGEESNIESKPIGDEVKDNIVDAGAIEHETTTDANPESNISPKSETNDEGDFKNETGEVPQTVRHGFLGIELDNSNEGELAIKEKDSVIGTIAKFLEKNSDKLTEGKMGFDPAKYSGSTLEEKIHNWSRIRAGIIAKEFANANSGYDLNKVSIGSSISLNLDNLADIKIEHLNDQYHLGGEVVSQESSISAENNAERLADVKETIRLENVTKNEMNLAHKIGITPKEYSAVNNVSVIDFMDRGNSSLTDASVQLKDAFKYLIKSGSINNVNISVSDAIRGLDEYALGEIFNENNHVFSPRFSVQENFNYSEYMGEMVRNELSEAMQDKSNLGLVFREISSIKGNIISGEPAGGLFDLFRKATEGVVGAENIKLGDNDTVAKYVVKSFKKAYELGKVEELKLALKNIK